MTLSDISAPPIVVVSGPTRGLGRAIFDQLISQGFPVVGVGRDLQRLAEVVKCAPCPVELVEVDLGADSAALTDALAAVRRILNSMPTGPLVLISNASAIEPIGQATDLAVSGLERSMRINCVAPLMMANFLTTTAKSQDRALLIVDVSSGAACRPIRGWQAYCTTKAACKMGLDVLAAENPAIRVIHFEPGVMDTSMQKRIREQKVADMPGVEVFRAYRDEGLLKNPSDVAVELIHLIRRHLK